MGSGARRSCRRSHSRSGGTGRWETGIFLGAACAAIAETARLALEGAIVAASKADAVVVGRDRRSPLSAVAVRWENGAAAQGVAPAQADRSPDSKSSRKIAELSKSCA